MVDVSDGDFYVLDVFRVIGGKDHAKFVHSHYGQITPTGLSLKPTRPYGHGTQMRNFRGDPSPKPGWSVDWTVDDRNRFLPEGTPVHLRYTDLTPDARACTAEGWVVAGIYNSTVESWIPRLMVRRQAQEAPLASTFVAVIEPYGKTSNIAAIRRLTLETASGTPYADNNVAVEVRLADGRRDLIVAADIENPLKLSPSRTKDGRLVQKDWNATLDGELCLVRQDQSGKPRRIAWCRGKSIDAGNVQLRSKTPCDLIEVRWDEQGKASVAPGLPEEVKKGVSITTVGR